MRIFLLYDLGLPGLDYIIRTPLGLVHYVSLAYISYKIFDTDDLELILHGCTHFILESFFLLWRLKCGSRFVS